MQEVNLVLGTAGNGYWSNVAKKVRVTKIALCVCEDIFDEDEEINFGEVRAYFNGDDWNISKDGFIYTDSQFHGELAAALLSMGFSSDAVDAVYYSEQGMQGDNYVSFDAGKAFLDAWTQSGRAFD